MTEDIEQLLHRSLDLADAKGLMLTAAHIASALDALHSERANSDQPALAADAQLQEGEGFNLV